MDRLSRSIGLITSLSLLLLILASCRDYQAEEQIRADAQTTTAQAEASAKIAVAQADQQARVSVAQAEAEAAKYQANQKAEADKYSSAQATAQAAIWADKLPMVATIATFALLAGIVLVYRGKIGLKRVDKEVLLLSSPPSPAPPPLQFSRPLPPPQVTVEAQRRNALVAPGDGPGVWCLILPDGRQLTMRPKQLTDSQQ